MVVAAKAVAAKAKEAKEEVDERRRFTKAHIVAVDFTLYRKNEYNRRRNGRSMRV